MACETRSCTDKSIYSHTVEPPNKGHFGNGHFVLFSEAVPISRRLAIV